MTNVSERPPGAIDPRADLGNPAVRAEWLAAARSQVEDLVFAADDATARPEERELGRRGARRIIGEASGALRDLLDAAGAPGLTEADRLLSRPLSATGRHSLARRKPPRMGAFEPRDSATPFERALLAFMHEDTPENEATLRKVAIAGGAEPDSIIANLRGR